MAVILAPWEDGAHYSASPLLSRGAAVNFAETNRRLGKSYWFKAYALRRFEKYGKRTLWVRRYGEDFSKAFCRAFLKTGHLRLFPEAMTTPEGVYLSGKLAIPFAAVSLCDSYRDCEDERIRGCVFDEATCRESRGRGYLKKEPELFLDLVESFTRGRARLFYLCNREHAINPHLDYWHMPRRAADFVGIDLAHGVAVDYRNVVSLLGTTGLDGVIRATTYGDRLAGVTRSVLSLRPRGAVYAYSLMCEGFAVDIYRHGAGLWAITTDSPGAVRYALTPAAGVRLVKDYRPALAGLRAAFLGGSIAYADDRARTVVSELYIPRL